MQIKFISSSFKTVLVLALGLSVTAANAADYVVVRSSSPSLLKGAQLSAGQKIDLGPGQQLTLVSTGGELTVLRGAAGGVTLPASAAGAARASTAALAALVTQPAPRRSFGAMRGKEDCPAPETLRTLEGILEAAELETCAALAQQALDRWVTERESGQK